jgi:hypothetical protein
MHHCRLYVMAAFQIYDVHFAPQRYFTVHIVLIDKFGSHYVY